MMQDFSEISYAQPEILSNTEDFSLSLDGQSRMLGHRHWLTLNSEFTASPNDHQHWIGFPQFGISPSYMHAWIKSQKLVRLHNYMIHDEMEINRHQFRG